VVFCMEQRADLHTAQLMPLPLTVSCFSKIQIGFTFLVPADLGSPGNRAVKRVCVCMMAVRWRYCGLYIAHAGLTSLQFIMNLEGCGVMQRWSGYLYWCLATAGVRLTPSVRRAVRSSRCSRSQPPTSTCPAVAAYEHLLPPPPAAACLDPATRDASLPRHYTVSLVCLHATLLVLLA